MNKERKAKLSLYSFIKLMISFVTRKKCIIFQTLELMNELSWNSIIIAQIEKYLIRKLCKKPDIKSLLLKVWSSLQNICGHIIGYL